MNHIETDRLIIRPAGTEDAPYFHALWSDGRVMRLVGFPEGLGQTLEQIEALLEKSQELGLFGRNLVVQRKADGMVLGEAFMGLPDEEGICITDVKLFPVHWGYRYGVEIKQALVDTLFSNTDCQQIEATPNKVNKASIKMQEAVGGGRIGEFHTPAPEESSVPRIDIEGYIYRVRRVDWEQRVQR